MLCAWMGSRCAGETFHCLDLSLDFLFFFRGSWQGPFEEHVRNVGPQERSVRPIINE
jgi:hypothetical protein